MAGAIVCGNGIECALQGESLGCPNVVRMAHEPRGISYYKSILKCYLEMVYIPESPAIDTVAW